MWQQANLRKELTKKQSMKNYPKNEQLFSPNTHRYMCVSVDKKCLFFEKFALLCFLVTSVLRFSLLRYYRR